MSRRFRSVCCAVALGSMAPLAVVTAAAEDSTTARIRATGRLTLGYRADARPFAYTDDSGLPAGYSIALCQTVANQVKRDLRMPALNVEWKPVAFDERFRSLRLGQIDLLCGADTDESGLPAGYSIALCQTVANQAKRDLRMPALNVEWKPVAFDERFRSLRLGQIDLLCGAYTLTLGRRSEADFSIPIFPGGI